MQEKPRRIVVILLGAPGSGKGTQAEKLANTLKLCHISTGDLLRNAMISGSELGLKAREYVRSGGLVPDEVVIGLVKDFIANRQNDNLLFDGFPRTYQQAVGLDNLIDSEDSLIVIELMVDDNAVTKRLSSRRICKSCGKIFNIPESDVQSKLSCNACSGELYQREDDKEETVAKRLHVYHEITKPIADFYASKGVLFTVNGDAPIDNVFESISRIVN